MMYLLYLGAALAALVGGMLFVYARRKLALASVMLRDAQDQLKLTKRDVETERREAQLRIKDEIYRKRSEFEIDIKRERSELDKQQRRLTEKFEAFEEREQRLDETRREIQQRERTISST